MKKIILITILLMTVLLTACVEDDSTTDIVEEFSEQDARLLAAQSICTEQGTLNENGMYNPNSKTWWFDIEQFAEKTKARCNPACVVFEETKQIEINWRCTGMIVPDENVTEEFMSCSDVNIVEIHECGEYTKVVMEMDGAGSTYYDLDNNEFTCPIVSLESMSDECKELMQIECTLICSDDVVSDFETCVAAGNPVMESYPEQCMHDGITYVNKIEIVEMCVDMCGDGKCAEVVCMAEGCPCAESPENCPEDCS